MEISKGNGTLTDRRLKPVLSRIVSKEAGCAFLPSFLDAQKIREWLYRKLHNGAPECPHCLHPVTSPKASQRWYGGKRIWCPHCHRRFSARTGSQLSGSNLKDPQIFLLAKLMPAGLDNTTLAELVGTTPETVKAWRLRLEAAP